MLSLCEEFECSYIPKKEYDKLIDNGYKFSEATISYTEDDTVDIQIDEYINIWLFLVKNGNENFQKMQKSFALRRKFRKFSGNE